MDIFCSRMLLFLCLAPLIALAAPAPPTHAFTLDNGLQILVREDHRAPLVTSHLLFKVGSSDEAPGQTGLSHILEHMLYKGSSKTCADEASAILQALGAEENAFTTEDATAYHQTLAPRYLGVTFELMADLMSTAALRSGNLTAEMAVIREERHLRVDDNGAARALERFTAIAQLTSSSRTPVIGWMHDLHRVNDAELRRWYETRYAPGNAVLVIVGDVTLEQVKPLAERYFGVLAKRHVPRLLRPVELESPGERKLTLRVSTHTPRLLMAFNVPGMATAKDPHTVHALRLINMLLAGSNSARLQKRLQFAEQLFSKVDSHYEDLTRGDTLLLLTAELADPAITDLDAAQARIWRLIEELHATAPTLEDLERARTQLIARHVYAQDSIEQQATELATLRSIDLPWNLRDQDAEALKQVTPEDIRQVAATWLTRERLSVAHVHVEKPHE